MKDKTSINDFYTSIEHGDLEKVKSYLPLAIWNQKNLGIRLAIRSGHLHIVQALLPHVNSRGYDGVYHCIFKASEEKQQEIFDFLYPFSNLQEIKRGIYFLKKESFCNYGEFDMLEQRIMIDEEKAILLSAVVDTDNIQRQKKI